jgi:hypothetical protein
LYFYVTISSCIWYLNKNLWEKFEDTNGIIRNHKSMMDRQHNGQKKRTKWQAMIYKTLHGKQKTKQHESHLKPEWNSESLNVWLKKKPKKIIKKKEISKKRKSKQWWS